MIILGSEFELAYEYFVSQTLRPSSTDAVGESKISGRKRALDKSNKGFNLITTSRRSASSHKVADKAVSKRTTTAEPKKQSSAPITKDKEAVTRKTEERSADDKKADEETSGHYELSPTMATALNDELSILMDKIEKVLPTTALNPTQKYVLDKMKNKVCADFCNVLSLNVAKRTLNVHNGLNVKIQLDRELPANALRSLKKRYNIVQMRAVANCPNTYLAVMKDFAEFDVLCAAKGAMIDDCKLTTTPFYKFTKCTENLRHRYFVKNNSAITNLKDNEEKTAVAQKTPQKTAVVQKTLQKTAVVQKTPQKNAVVQKTPQKTAVDEKCPQKTVVAQKTTVVQKTPQKTVVAQKTTVVQKTTQKTAVVQKSPQKTALVQETAVAQKTAEKTAVAQKTPLHNKTIAATSNTQNVASANKVSTQKPTNTTLPKEIVKPNVSNDDKIVKHENDDVSSQDTKRLTKDLKEINIESQDLADFLADGIVVDECMGSDDE